MIKKVIIAVVIIIIGVAGYVAYTMLTTRNHSPEANVKFEHNDFVAEIKYCAPFKKNRVIFGDKKSGAIQPYNVYWRLGANELTSFTFNKPITFGNKKIEAGTYSIYAYPGKNEFKLVINKTVGEWGYFEPDKKLDVAEVLAPVTILETPVEQFKINIEMGKLVFMWDTVKFEAPFSY